ncbi:hypothetical protein M0P65_01115 [Candidatus Gracilibacteria bacterium]|nr:hypothetical protein [Candidatus Gracilibacteria bacterium]
MTDALSSKLDEIQLEAERKKGGIVFIYSLIEDNLREYQGIFHIQEAEINLAKEFMFKTLERILERLIDKETRSFGVDIYARKLNKLNEENIFVNLGFVELKPSISREEMEKEARIQILENKKSDIKKGFLKIFKNQDEIEITSDEITYYINNRAWAHCLVLTQKGRDIINKYLRATGRNELDVIKGKVNETREKMLGITCSI